MDLNCNACGGLIQDELYMKCSECSEHYDIICLTMSREQFNETNNEYRASWLCPSCTSTRPRGDNSSTPVRAGAAPPRIDCNVNTKRGSRPQCNTKTSLPRSDLELLIEEVRQLRKEVKDLKQENIELKDEVKAYHQVLNNTLKDHSTKLEIVDREVSDLRSTVNSLCQLVNKYEQDSLRSEVEIIGLPEGPNENLCHVVMLATKKLGVTLSEDDIDNVTRVGPKQRGKADTHNKLPRPIVLKLLRRRKRDEIVGAAKSRRNLTSEGIIDGEPHRIYCNERLTKSNRQLFQAARIRAKKHSFRYCWAKNGLILIRRSDGTPAIPISSMFDLDQKLDRIRLRIMLLQRSNITSILVCFSYKMKVYHWKQNFHTSTLRHTQYTLQHTFFTKYTNTHPCQLLLLLCYKNRVPATESNRHSRLKHNYFISLFLFIYLLVNFLM